MDINQYASDISPSVFEFINNICITIKIMDETWPLEKTIKNQSLLPNPLITKVDIVDLLYVQSKDANKEYIRKLHHMIHEFKSCTGTRPRIHTDNTLCKQSLHNISYYMTLYKAEKIYLLIFYN